MEDKKNQVIKYIKERVSNLSELGKVYSNEKIETLATNLVNTNKELPDIYTLIDNKFANQVRKLNHNRYLASLKEFYISSIDKLKKGNNCYLLSYDQGIKVLEQAYVTDLKQINPFLQLVNVNNESKAYRKPNDKNNDYELIMSDIAYLLGIDYAKTYRIFDGNMEPQGILNITFEKDNERFLNLEETLRFIKEESTNFTLTQELLNYHDRNIRFGLKKATQKEDYKDNLEYVFNLFKALPDITDENYEQLKKSYLNIKVFELLTNSLNNNLTNVGIIINKETKKYTYRISPAYNKYSVNLPTLTENQTICNFFIVDKTELLKLLIGNYYRDIKDLLSLIVDNQKTLLPIIKQIIKEHLEYDEFNNYYNVVSKNLNLITELITEKKKTIPDNPLEESDSIERNNAYNHRIEPFIDNYVADEYEEPNKGSTILTIIVGIIMLATIGIILLTIYAVSKMNM